MSTVLAADEAAGGGGVAEEEAEDKDDAETEAEAIACPCVSVGDAFPQPAALANERVPAKSNPCGR